MEYETEDEGILDSVKNRLRRYIPRPGVLGSLGGLLGAGLGSLAGFACSGLYHLVADCNEYLQRSDFTGLFRDAYTHASIAGGTFGVIGGVCGFFIFSKARDYVLCRLGLK